MKIKTLFINLSLFLAAVLPSLSFAARPDAQSDTLAAQVRVTHDALQQVLAKMRNAPNEQAGGFSNPDFIAKAEEFNRRVEAAMVRFEATLKNTILKQASFYVDRLNAIQSSTAYSRDQKQALFQDQVNLALAILDGLSKKYAGAIYELYTLGLPQAEIEFRGKNGECDWERSADGLSQKSYGYMVAILPFDIKSADPRIGNRLAQGNVVQTYDLRDCYQFYRHFAKGRTRFYEVYFPDLGDLIFSDSVRKGCYSSSCIALYANHRLAYLNLIKNDIDKPIEFSVGGEKLWLRSLEFLSGNMKRYFDLRESDTANLPFDISEDEYRQALEQERNAQERERQAELHKQREFKLRDLRDTLLGASGLFSYKCPARVGEIKAELCQSELGCLTSVETDSLVSAIESAQLFRISERIHCLNSR